MHSDTARFGIKVFKDCIILFCLSVLKKKMKSTLSEYFKAKIQSVKAIAAQNTFYSCLQGSFEHSLNFQILREYLQSALFFLEGLDIWVQSTNFFFWQIFSTYSNKVVVTEKFIEEKKPYPWNNKLYPFIRQCVSVGESGLLLAVKPPNTDKFYLGPKTMNEKKIMKNVLQLGDEFFNFGDLVYLDHDYYVYFRDRIGDTFR